MGWCCGGSGRCGGDRGWAAVVLATGRCGGAVGGCRVGFAGSRRQVALEL